MILLFCSRDILYEKQILVEWHQSEYVGQGIRVTASGISGGPVSLHDTATNDRNSGATVRRCSCDFMPSGITYVNLNYTRRALGNGPEFATGRSLECCNFVGVIDGERLQPFM